MQEFTTLFISRRIAGSYQLFPQVGLSSCSSLPTTTSSARSPALTSSSLRLVGLSSCSCLPTTTSSARSPAQTSPHLVELKQGGACSVFPKRLSQKILTPGWRLWWPYQNWQVWGQVRVEATRGLPKLNFHEELQVSSSVCRMGPRSLVLMKVKVILCTLYLSSCYIFNS